MNETIIFFVYSLFSLIKIFGIVITSSVYGILGNVNNTRSQTAAALLVMRPPVIDLCDPIRGRRDNCSPGCTV